MTRGAVTVRAVVVPPQRERDFQKAVVALARVLGWRIHVVWSSVHSPSGWPDLFLVRKGRIVAAELKSARGKVSIVQQQWLDDLAACGIATFVWRPSDWPAITEVLK